MAEFVFDDLGNNDTVLLAVLVDAVLSLGQEDMDQLMKYAKHLIEKRYPECSDDFLERFKVVTERAGIK